MFVMEFFYKPICQFRIILNYYLSQLDIDIYHIYIMLQINIVLAYRPMPSFTKPIACYFEWNKQKISN